ncbi:MAG: hypothetical protein KIS69_11430 [Bacteroidetes bacterium]|nr:hypothetical protein [Bacteroidota bacterium]
MKLVQQNPYRIAGILSNTSEKDLLKQKSKIKRFSEVGKAITSDYDFSFLTPVSRENGTIEKAFSNIEQNQDKVNHALFWFLNTNNFDETAINYLKTGDKEKAIEIWEKITDGKEVSSKNFSAFNNIGTLYFLNNSKQETKKGIEAKIKLLESEHFKDFAHSVADETFTIDADKQIEIFVEELLKQFKNQFSTAETLDLFGNCNGTTQKYLSKRFTEEPVHKIEIQIEKTKTDRSKNKLNAFRVGKNLYQNTKSELALLKSILGSTGLQYKLLADNVAKEVLQCSIDYFNESQENDSQGDYLAEAMQLAKLADSVAVNSVTKGRIKDSISTLEGMKERDLNQAIAILHSIKLAYENAIREIDSQVAKMRLTMSFNQSINYSKIDKLKADCLDWNKVIEVVRDGIKLKNVQAIERSSNQTKVNEYKSLVDFLFSKLGPFQINQIKHICYWKDVRADQIKSGAKQVGSTIGKATEGCYIATMAYGDYEHPQVLELRKFRDEILQKTTGGRIFIKVYYSISPKLVEILKNKKKINSLIRKGLNQFIKIIR